MGFELVLPVEPRFMASAVAVDDWAAEGSLVLVFEHVPLELEFSFEVCLDLASGPGAHEARVVFSGVLPEPVLLRSALLDRGEEDKVIILGW